MRRWCRAIVLSARAGAYKFFSDGGVKPAVLPVVGVSREAYAARRKRLMALMEPNSIVVLPAADDTIASHDLLNEHRQDSMLYHLFGLEVPMRPSYSPPGCDATGDENFKLTCAVLARDDATSTPGSLLVKTRTQLFVPQQTTDGGVLPWAEETRTLRRFHEELFAPSGEGHESVAANDMETVLTSLTSLIAAMTEVALEQRGQALQQLLRASHVKPSDLRAVNPLPRVYVHLPRQLRWTGEVFHLPSPATSTVKDGTNGHAAFTHPLQALMHILYSLSIGVQHQGSDTLVCHCRYQQPTTRPLSPGLPNPSAQQQQHLQALYPRELVRHCGAASDASSPSTKERTETPAPSSSRRVELSWPIQLPTRHLEEYRLRKSPLQVAQHVCSAASTHLAFVATMRCARHTTQEHVLHAAFQSTVRELAAATTTIAGDAVKPTQVRAAYIPVVAVGRSATKIHYTTNGATGKAGDLCRLDAGVEVDLVPCDCTRTFPVGEAEEFWTAPSSRKRILYDGVLGIQRQLLTSMQCGTEIEYVANLHISSTAALVRRLIDGGHTHDTSVAAVPASLVREVLCAHCFGHPFGLDIHETLPPHRSTTKRSRTLLGGMMHTVEPGVYVPAADTQLFKALSCSERRDVAEGLKDLCGVGAQIEDDVLILPGVQAGEEDSSGCPWSRQDYLAALCGVYDDLERADSPAFFPLVGYDRETVALLSDSRERLPRECWIALLLLFTQRVAFEGPSTAARELRTDAARVEKALAGLTDSSERRAASWFPFGAVVLTAFTPKDVPLMEQIVRASVGTR